MGSSGDEKEDTQEDDLEKDKEGSEVVLDLTGRRLKRLERAPVNQTFATALVLDNNQLQNLANLDSYGELERLSIANNQIVRMYWFARMYSLRILNLPSNSIVQIEGLRELHHLIHLNLANNNIKNVEGLSCSHKLEHLNLSGNCITQVGDLYLLKNLKELFLHRNRLTSLHRCNKFLPSSLLILTLSDNGLLDLNELCSLSHLTNLEQFTILNNPCVDALQLVDESGGPSGAPLAFDYRPYVINWCLNLKVLDGYKVTPKESLKAEWLYSQGKGRGFQTGEHPALVQYLSGVCLAGGGWGGAELPDDEDKLAKILQLAKQHQQELRHSSCVNGHDNSDSSSGCGSRGSSHHDSPSSHRKSSSRNSSLKRSAGPQRPSKPQKEFHLRANSHTPVAPAPTPASVPRTVQDTSHSYHVELSSTLYGGDLKTPETPGLMTQSMDPALLAQLSAPDRPKKGPAVPSLQQMSQSLGPEQMARSLDADYGLSSSMGSALECHRGGGDLMQQSLCSDQLKRSFICSSSDDRWDHDDFTSRPSKLFGEDTDSTSCDADSLEGGHLDGSSQFVPAPESLMSPEFKSAEMPSIPKSNSSQNATSKSAPKSSTKAGKPPIAGRPSSSPHITPRPTNVRSSSSQRPRTTSAKSPAPPPDATRCSPRSQRSASTTSAQASTPSSSSVQSRAKQSPKPAPRYSRSSSVSQTTPSSQSCKKELQQLQLESPSGRAFSEGESDNTDSEMSVSKLQTIKSIAAERKGKERKTSGGPSSHKRPQSPPTGALTQHHKSGGSHSYNPERYKGSGSPRRKSDNKGGRKTCHNHSGAGSILSRPRGAKMNETDAAITLQKHWRGYRDRIKNPATSKLRGSIRCSRAEQHIRHLAEKLKAAEVALERERKLRHLQLDAIRALWREIQKLQTGRKDGITTPSTPMTPLTPLTPLERGEKGAAAAVVAPNLPKGKIYSEESVKELTEFCSSLQGQVTQLHESLSMVTQVMNAFCHLPGSQSLLTMSQSSGSGLEKSMGEDEMITSTLSQTGSNNVSLSESVATFTTSIRALTTSIVKSPTATTASDPAEGAQLVLLKGRPKVCDATATSSAKVDLGPTLQRPGLTTSVTSLISNDLTSTGNDVSTLSIDSTDAADRTQPEEADLSDSSQSSLSASFSGSPSLGVGNGGASASGGGGHGQSRLGAPTRPSSLPVPRPHTPRANS